MYKNFFFDFDGTIFDSYDHTTVAFIETIKKTRGIVLDYQEVYDALRISHGNCFMHFNTSEEERNLFSTIQHDVDLEPKIIPYDKTIEFFEYLYNKNYRIFMYTNRGEQTFVYLKMYDLDKYVLDSIIAGRFPYKPNPESLNYMVNKYNLDIKECLVVGDRKVDIDGGINANMDGLLIDEFDKINDSNATYKVNCLKEAFELIKKMNGD